MKRLLLAALAGTAAVLGQDAHEQLGSGFSAELKGEHPLLAIEAAHPATLKPELANVHPRLFVTDAELADLRQRAHSSEKALWQRALDNNLCLTIQPVPAPAQGRRDQNDTALAMAEAAFMYKIEGDPRYLAAARKFMDAAVSYDTWGYTTNKPNVDLAAGHLLYALGWSYDLLYHDLSEADRARYRDKIAKQGHLLYLSYALTPGKTFTYSQNHLFIPAAGLGIAAYAVYGEVPEAAAWATRARALYDRVLATYSKDGYYYEGFEYWIFATPWLVHYLDALAHCTGEDLYDQPGLRLSYEYVAHSILPDGKNVVDFGDVFEGARTRLGVGEDVLRTHPGGHLHSNYHVLYRLAQRFQDPNAQGVAEWMASLGQTNFEDYWALVWFDPKLKATPITEQPTWHYFKDQEVVMWRSSWDSSATALAVKCGPPEGHHTEGFAKEHRDWRLEDGHAHPDAGSFILYADGKYLVGETGYAGVPMTSDQNTLLIDGKGQAREGSGHNAFDGVPYRQLDRIRITSVEAGTDSLAIVADATAAYDPSLGLTSFVRTFRVSAKSLTIDDAVRLSGAHALSLLYHFDGKGVPAGLSIAATEPKDAVVATDKEFVTAAGPPGHVDRGPREERGSKLTVSTAAPTDSATFTTSLTWK